MSTNKRLPIRCYDNGGKTFDRYTVVFTKPDHVTWGNEPPIYFYSYIGMSSDPFHPQGFGQHGESGNCPIDKPSGKHLGRKIQFRSLPPDCQKVVLQDLKGG